MSEARPLEPTDPAPATPYVGLVPYRVEDAAFFFGRDEEKGIVAGNLRASRLTIVYGPSGVGKSSLLHAGVIHELRRQVLANLDASAERAPFAICSFGNWRDEPLPALVETIRTAAVDALGGEELAPWSPGEPLLDVLAAWTQRVRTLLVVLDQFEDYFLYHPDEDGDGTFAVEFPRVVNEPNLRVNFMLSIREDAWAKLDRFEGRIPRLFANYVRVEHLNREAAQKAITGPVDEWNRRLPPEAVPYSVEPALVGAVSDATAAGQISLDEDRESGVPEAARSDAIEAPFLQLVMERLWAATVEAGSSELTLSRLEALGGAQRIVENHLQDALSSLTNAEKAVAADAFRYLVTRSKTKIAHPAADLADWTKRSESEMSAVLNKLCRGESGRILRPVPSSGEHEPTRYELFHDVLAEPILDWRRGYEHRRARRRVAGAGVLASALVAIFAGLGVWALVQRSEAVRATKSASALALVSAATSLVVSRPDEALLLALSGSENKVTPQTRSAMTLALETASASGFEAILHGNCDHVNSVVFAPGTTLATACFNGTTLLWDTARRRLDASLRSPDCSSVDNVAFAPDGKTLAAGCGGGTTVLWDVGGAKPLGKPLSNKSCGSVDSVAFAPGGGMLATGCAAGTTLLWDVAAAKLIGTPLSRRGCEAVNSVAFAPGGHTLAVGCGSGDTMLWDVATEKPLGPPLSTPGCAGVSSVAFAPGGATLAVGCSGSAVLWDVAATRPAPTPLVSPGCGSVTSLAFAAQGRRLAVGCEGPATVVWDAATGRTLGAPISSPGCASVRSVAFSRGGQTLAVGCYQGQTFLWNVGASRLRGAGSAGPSCSGGRRVAFAPDGKTLALGCGDGRTVLWGLAAGKPRGAPLPSAGCNSVNALAFAPDERTLAVGCADGRTVLWDVIGRKPLPPPAPSIRCGGVTSVAFAAGGGTLAIACVPGGTVLWDIAARKQVGAPLPLGRCGGVNGLAFDPGESTLALGCNDGSVVLWDAGSRKAIGAPLSTSGCGSVNGVAFTPQGATLAVACEAEGTDLWDVATRKRVGAPLLTTGCDSVYTVAFAPGGGTLAVGCIDRTVLWDVAAESTLGGPITSAGCTSVSSVAFSAREGTLAIGCDSGQTVLGRSVAWSSPNELQSQVCQLVWGDLTPDEWRILAPGLPYQAAC